MFRRRVYIWRWSGTGQETQESADTTQPPEMRKISGEAWTVPTINVGRTVFFEFAPASPRIKRSALHPSKEPRRNAPCIGLQLFAQPIATNMTATSQIAPGKFLKIMMADRKYTGND